MKTHTHITRYTTGIYTYLPGRDIMADLAKAERKKYAKPKRTVPRLATVYRRFHDQLRHRIESGNPPEQITLFPVRKHSDPQVTRYYFGIQQLCFDAGIPVHSADPADWGFPS